MVPTVEVVVVSRNTEAESVISLELGSATGEPLPSWTPGAHLDVWLPNGLIRQYSLCGDCGDTGDTGDTGSGTWRVAVLAEPRSRGGSAWLHDNATEGTRLKVVGPRNHFELLPARGYVFIAGGIGITPLLPMVAKAQRDGAGWRLWYGGRSRRSMAFLEELERYGERVRVWPQDEHGLLDLPAILGELESGTLVYCCGPASLLDAVQEHCRELPPKTLHVERFTASERRDGGEDDRPFEVECAASGLTVTVPAGVSILDSLARAGVEVPSSCTEGVCATCETVVLDGEPDHRDSVLSEEEREEGEVMMICVSRAKGGRLVLDV
ncbi:flavodoxin reductase family protein [Saccharomonospora marina XMU15]|uniref:Flavodoxin reductase family protein n=1 Tax=Saccharomonospora marina XMU15 TaxID=882083 RepID=H5WYW1_9PSEU|nr:flavodoxin reductase family protein [Saccharomonospora marina XMU15]